MPIKPPPPPGGSAVSPSPPPPPKKTEGDTATAAARVKSQTVETRLEVYLGLTYALGAAVAILKTLLACDDLSPGQDKAIMAVLEEIEAKQFKEQPQ